MGEEGEGRYAWYWNLEPLCLMNCCSLSLEEGEGTYQWQKSLETTNRFSGSSK